MKTVKHMALVLLAILVLCAGCAKTSSPASAESGAGALAQDDPLGIRSITVESVPGVVTMEEQDGQTCYTIHLELPMETDFARAGMAVELAPNARISDASSCITDELMGRFLLNLTVDDAQITVENGEEQRAYSFEIALL